MKRSPCPPDPSTLSPGSFTVVQSSVPSSHWLPIHKNAIWWQEEMPSVEVGEGIRWGINGDGEKKKSLKREDALRLLCLWKSTLEIKGTLKVPHASEETY